MWKKTICLHLVLLMLVQLMTCGVVYAEGAVDDILEAESGTVFKEQFVSLSADSTEVPSVESAANLCASASDVDVQTLPGLLYSSEGIIADGLIFPCDIYKIDGYNYISVRDFATATGVSVEYDKNNNIISFSTKTYYPPTGTTGDIENIWTPSNVPFSPATIPISINGIEIDDIPAWNINGKNYMQLDALTRSFGFSIVDDNTIYTYDRDSISTLPIRLDIVNGSIDIYGKSDCIFFRQNDTDYYGTGGCIIQQSDNGIASENTITVHNGSVKLTISGLNVSSQTSPISVENGAALELTLSGSSILQRCKESYSEACIFVDANASLILGGKGSVLCKGGYGAGVGGNLDNQVTIYDGTILAEGRMGGFYCGKIVINDGRIEATGKNGSTCAAGIDAKEITINGGNVLAIGGNECAGIGNGNFSKNAGNYSVIEINGGEVAAFGGSYGAGIGGGHSRSFKSVTINGGVVTATGGMLAPGIGNGAGSSDGGKIIGAGGKISLNAGSVSAKGYYHAIGGGAVENNHGCDSIIVNSGVDLQLTHTNSSGADYQEIITTYTQPVDSAALLRNDSCFVVDAFGHSGLFYQWQLSTDGTVWNDVEGETTNVAMIPVTTATNGALVRCELTNGWGNVVYTDPVKVYILDFSQQPENIEVTAGECAMLSVVSTCSNVTYQWQRSIDGGASWANLTGECYADLILNGSLSDEGLYRCVITATNGDELASNPATVTITDPNAPITYKTIYYQQNADGKTYTAYEQSVNSGTVGESVTAPQKSYEHFTENTSKGTVSGTVAADGTLILSRYYDRNSYTISFDMDGGSAEVPITAVHGAAVTAPANPTKPGYTFEGWYSDEDLTTPYTFTVMPTENTTVYAKWTIEGAGRGIEYEIAGIQLRDSSYQVITKAPKGTFYAEVSVRNLSSETMDTLVLAAYDGDGKLLDMKFLYANPMVGQTFTLGAGMDNSAGNIAVLKAFMLPMLGGLVPLAESVEYRC